MIGSDAKLISRGATVIDSGATLIDIDATVTSRLATVIGSAATVIDSGTFRRYDIYRAVHTMHSTAQVIRSRFYQLQGINNFQNETYRSVSKYIYIELSIYRAI